jgi:hypothetical protein
MKLFSFSIFALLVVTAASYAGTGLAFLEIPVGARENALGGAGAALVTGPTSVTFNPAAAAFTPRGVALMLNNHFAGTRAEYIAVNVRRGRFAFTPHYWGTRVPDIEYRIAPTRQPISTFDAVNSAAGVTAAFAVNDKLAIGATGHYLYQKIQVEASDGWAIDAGAQVRNCVPGLTVGAAVQHMGAMSRFIGERPTLPVTLRAGAAYERKYEGVGTFLLTADGQAVRDNTPLFHGGLEYRAPNWVALRAGWVEGLDTQNFAAGFGLFFKGLRVDYAFVPYRENFGDGHRFSVALDI